MPFLLFEIWKHRISVFDAKVLEMLQRSGIIELGIRHPLNMVDQQNLEFEDLKIQVEKVEVFQGQSYWWQGEAKDDCDDFRSFPLSSSQTNYDKMKYIKRTHIITHRTWARKRVVKNEKQREGKNGSKNISLSRYYRKPKKSLVRCSELEKSMFEFEKGVKKFEKVCQ